VGLATRRVIAAGHGIVQEPDYRPDPCPETLLAARTTSSECRGKTKGARLFPDPIGSKLGGWTTLTLWGYKA